MNIDGRDNKKTFKTPGLVLEWYGKDQPEGGGVDPLTAHLKPNKVWDKIEYRFNSLGLRGPEPDYNAKHRILSAGGSLAIGVGVKEEETYVSRLSKKIPNSSYINLSDYDTFTDMYDDLKEYINKFKPTIIILGDTRFVDEYGFTWRKLYHEKKFDKDFILKIRKVLHNRNRKTVELMLYYIKNEFNVPTFFVYGKRKDFNFEIDDSIIINPLDLGRDGRHLGPDSHEYIADKIYNELQLD
jgi:hypothetical protein